MSSCITVESYNPETTMPYYPPRYKIIEEKRFSFSYSERRKALESLNGVDADTLFELIIDRKGNVVKARLLRTHVRSYYHDDLETHAKRFKFSPKNTEKPYRTFYYPVKYRYNASFEWM